MKRFLLACISSLIVVSQASAIVGGPFDNNSFFGQDSTGTYQGVISGNGISGILIFGTSGTSRPRNEQEVDTTQTSIGTYGNGGRALIFVNGNLIPSEVMSSSDLGNRKMSLTIQGSIDHGVTESVYFNPRNVSGTGNTYVLTGASQLSGFLDAKFNRTYPQLEFSGSGELTLLTATDLQPVYEAGVMTGYEVVTYSRDYDVSYYGVRTAYVTPFIAGTLEWNAPSLEIIPD